MAEPIQTSDLGGLFACLAPYDRVVIGVSGGADSLCLMHLLSEWAQGLGAQAPELQVATVDHRLRETSGAEAADVALRAARLGIPHSTLVWEGDKPQSGLQAEARVARYRLLEEAARGRGRAAVAVAHTEDDQAETLLMRLMRGSGVDGLSAMPVVRPLGPGVDLVRPLLSLARARIEATLRARGISWVSDPSNDNPAFERVRLRAALGRACEDLGLSRQMLALSAARLGRARAALDEVARDVLMREVAWHEGAFASLSREAVLRMPEEIRVRVLERLIRAFGDREAPALLGQVETLSGELARDGDHRASLGGAIVSAGDRVLRIYREAGRLGDRMVLLEPGQDAVWDGRFRISAEASHAASGPFEVGALARGGRVPVDATLEAAGLELPPFARNWPKRALGTLPAVWAASRLIAVPHLDPGQGSETGFRVKFLGLEG